MSSTNFDLAADQALKFMLDASSEAHKVSSDKKPTATNLSPQALYARANSYIDVYGKLLSTHRSLLEPEELAFHLGNYNQLVAQREAVAKYKYSKLHFFDYLAFKNESKKSARMLMESSEQCRVEYIGKELQERLVTSGRPALTEAAFSSISAQYAAYNPSVPTEGSSIV